MTEKKSLLRTRADILSHDRPSNSAHATEQGRGRTDTGAHLPHERDEYPDLKHTDRRGSGPRGVMDQAANDIATGRRDTASRGGRAMCLLAGDVRPLPKGSRQLM
jgi:hypothetical protein